MSIQKQFAVKHARFFFLFQVCALFGSHADQNAIFALLYYGVLNLLIWLVVLQYYFETAMSLVVIVQAIGFVVSWVHRALCLNQILLLCSFAFMTAFHSDHKPVILLLAYCSIVLSSNLRFYLITTKRTSRSTFIYFEKHFMKKEHDWKKSFLHSKWGWAWSVILMWSVLRLNVYCR